MRSLGLGGSSKCVSVGFRLNLAAGGGYFVCEGRYGPAGPGGVVLRGAHTGCCSTGCASARWWENGVW